MRDSRNGATALSLLMAPDSILTRFHGFKLLSELSISKGALECNFSRRLNGAMVNVVPYRSSCQRLIETQTGKTLRCSAPNAV